MAIAVPALAEFADRLGAASWFSVIGEALTPAEHADAASYMKSLGLKEVATSEIASWGDTEACIKAADWDSGWWDAEERLRLDLLARAEERFGPTATLEALSGGDSTTG